MVISAVEFFAKNPLLQSLNMLQVIFMVIFTVECFARNLLLLSL
jgi:hypothetical protein